MLEFGVHADGYWADITRSLVVGGPTEEHRKIHATILKAQQAAVAAYVPNRSTGEEMCQASWDAMREAGFGEFITHSLGHGLGFAYHEDRPILGPGEKSAIRPGHVTLISRVCTSEETTSRLQGSGSRTTWFGETRRARQNFVGVLSRAESGEWTDLN
jgi:Xaa-Pro aminopeptidase